MLTNERIDKSLFDLAIVGGEPARLSVAAKALRA